MARGEQAPGASRSHQPGADYADRIACLCHAFSLGDMDSFPGAPAIDYIGTLSTATPLFSWDSLSGNGWPQV